MFYLVYKQEDEAAARLIGKNTIFFFNENVWKMAKKKNNTQINKQINKVNMELQGT